MVKNSQETTEKRVFDRITRINKVFKNTIKWRGDTMNILIPAAGAGSRFAKNGYTFPKPLIDVNGKPMIQVVVENLSIEGNYIYIVQKEHYDKYNLKYLLNMITPNCTIIIVDHITEGAACTTLLAKEYINNNQPLLLANSDQYVQWSSVEFMYAMGAGNTDGGILTFKSTHPKWSYAKLDEELNISEIAEKKVISDIATVGVYYWSTGSDYVKYAEQMISKDIRVNNEFYVAPVYNEAIADNKKFKTFDVDKMWGLGTPEDLQQFLKEHDTVFQQNIL
jgi:dTDP-glucose pyrophosphorylase